MKTAILCGGQGTRFREVSDVIPKPMAPIGDRPILWHIMKIYAAYGCHDFVLLLGYKGDVIRDFFLNAAGGARAEVSRDDSNSLTFHQENSEPWRVTLVDTGEKAMTGARVWRARRYLESEGFFGLTYGDGVGNIDIGALQKFHQSHGQVATLTGVHPPGRFGELVIKDGRVIKFQEKPQTTQYINGGFFVFNATVFDRYLNDRDDLVLEREPLQRMAADGELMMYAHEGFWQHMDTPHEFELLNNLWKSGNAPWVLVAEAIQKDMAPLAKRLQEILKKDDTELEPALKQLLADWPEVEKEVLKSGNTAKAMRKILTKAFIDGLTGK